jgi:rhomboid protease GluP
MVIAGLVLAVTLILLWKIPPYAGFIGIVFWLVFILVPSLGARILQGLIFQQKYRKAALLSSWLRWLHPADGWLEQHHMYRALDLADRGFVDEASNLLEPLMAKGETSIGFAATAVYFRVNQKWTEFLEWYEKNKGDELSRRDPNLLLGYFRALGETGKLNELLAAFARNEKYLSAVDLRIYWGLGAMIIFAFCGRRQQLEKLFQNHRHSEETQKFWIGTTDLTGGNVIEGEKRLEALKENCTPFTKLMIEKRLAAPIASAEILNPQSKEILARLETELAHHEEFGEGSELRSYRPYLTWIFIALNCVVYFEEMFKGGGDNLLTIYQLGALRVDEVLAGEWSRLFRANFLHFGFLHLIMNMLGLLVLGPFLERGLGRARYAILYLLSGVGSSVMIVLFERVGWLTHGVIYMGASGNIMGLVGGTIAFLLAAHQRKKSMILRNRLSTSFTIVGVQVVFDLLTPGVSFTAHFAGLLIGYSLAKILILRSAKSELKN